MRMCVRAAAVAALLSAAPSASFAQAQAAPTLPPIPFCGQQAAAPRAQPPAGSPPVVLAFGPCFEGQGGTSVIEPQTYLYYIQLKQSRPSEGVWIPYDDASDKVIEDDFHRLWNTNFLDNLFVEANDYKFPNGTIGKVIVYNMEERQRVKIVDYVGSKKIETSKIDEKLKDANAQIRLDTFIDPGLVRKVSGIVRDMLREKGFQFAEVTPEIKEIQGGGPKLVHITFNMDEGPKVKIRSIDFVGNKAIGDGTLKRQLKDNTERGAFTDFIHFPLWFMSLIGDHGTYQETKFDDDAEKIVAYYRDHGYLRANVGVPEIKVLSDADDKKTRWVELKIPITEGPRYKVGAFDVAGNTVVRTDYLKPLFKMNPGEYYGEKRIRKGLEKAREVYGTGGYYEFTGFPDYKFHDDPNQSQPEAPEALRPPEAPKTQTNGDPLVDVTMRIQEGQQFFVNRITFVGNTTTRDNVIRREMRLVEGGVFNTEALKYSVKRLNQLGYFKALEGKPGEVDVQKTPNETNKIDVKLKLEEQNRNSLTFGAGVSEFEGFFGQLSFQTANFLGRGESLTLSLQAGSRAQNYSLAFTEPFLFDRNITGGFNVFRQDIRYVNQFTQRSMGAVTTFGFPIGRGFTRMFVNYSYERVRVTEINAVYTDPIVLARNPFLRDSLLLGQGGERIISKVSPSIVYNSVDQPIFPTSGKRYTASIELAGLGGNTNFYKPILEAGHYWKQANRLTLGMRGQFEYIHQLAGSKELPIFEKLFLGGEYSVRGFDIRTIGPQDPQTGLVLGGNKSLLFNVEEQFTIAGPVRLIAFYDAGQVQPGPTIVGPPAFVPDGGSIGYRLAPGKNFVFEDFKTSTGLEVRFFMPVLNVPFRLIFAYNPQRSGVLDNSLQPQKAFQFRFAVGSTF
jgi:outer membrane protein insertion porin family